MPKFEWPGEWRYDEYPDEEYPDEEQDEPTTPGDVYAGRASGLAWEMWREWQGDREAAVREAEDGFADVLRAAYTEALDDAREQHEFRVNLSQPEMGGSPYELDVRPTLDDLLAALARHYRRLRQPRGYGECRHHCRKCQRPHWRQDGRVFVTVSDGGGIPCPVDRAECEGAD